ncbi:MULTISPECIES: type III pantothenate kinase [unclassified Leeuwenhoekiella]|uniref:type III pantothenate kinase n=1 Tax=unclassified Leeuwenhoekiella TaxID=2615029 RepID=UPI000C3D607E|nr:MULTISPECIES: type III pantothenate kinase [unclassified Leeuwenhoekiella]MAW97163.1 pantothenate kinase [Leeuwenhoekiella sp.]MBA82751.1 pantothenate kinase [Leeuwenhoekiella sp.]|tara:strand:- start:4887 stop:5618 length:732 start_codon:yes stop_codon:yes gene_type:complete
MTTLAIDFGNTRVKFGLFKDGALEVSYSVLAGEAQDQLLELQESANPHAIVFCATGNSKDFVTFLKKRGLSYKVVEAATPVPYTNLYKTPETLGLDRKVLMVTAFKECSGINTLVIDAGTCVTYDFKNKEDTYLGGAISPGLQMRFKAMHQFTAKLPDLEISKDQVELIGTDTYSAMQSGVINGLVAELDGLIDRYKLEYDELKIILTGGDGLFLSDRLKNGIFADSNFLLKGLNYIVEFNRT